MGAYLSFHPHYKVVGAVSCPINEELKERDLPLDDDLIPYDDRMALILTCGDCCDCAFLQKNGGLGAL